MKRWLHRVLNIDPEDLGLRIPEDGDQRFRAIVIAIPG